MYSESVLVYASCNSRSLSVWRILSAPVIKAKQLCIILIWPRNVKFNCLQFCSYSVHPPFRCFFDWDRENVIWITSHIWVYYCWCRHLKSTFLFKLLLLTVMYFNMLVSKIFLFENLWWMYQCIYEVFKSKMPQKQIWLVPRGFI